MSKVKEELLYLIGEKPEISSIELAEFFADSQKPEVRKALRELHETGLVDRRLAPPGNKKGRRPFAYIRCEGTPKYRQHSVAKYAVSPLVGELKDQVADLKAWQREAIARFPELAVPEIVLNARKIVSEQLREDGDFTGAARVMNGDRDATAILRATVRALERSSA